MNKRRTVALDFSKGGQLVEREPVMHLCSKGGHQHADLPQEKNHQQVEGGDPPPLRSTCGTHPENWSPQQWNK